MNSSDEQESQGIRRQETDLTKNLRDGVEDCHSLVYDKTSSEY